MNKFQKQPDPQPQQMSQEEQMQLISQEIENLQNAGIFHLKLLGSLERQTNSIKELNQTMIDFGTELFPLLAQRNEVPEGLEDIERDVKVEDTDDFELPPMPSKKK